MIGDRRERRGERGRCAATARVGINGRGEAHPHLHQPTDTADTINPEIFRTIARYVLVLTWQLANTQ